MDIVNIATVFNEFKDTLFNKKKIRYKMRRNKVKKYKMGTCKINKLSLSVFDDKIFVLNDGIQTLAYFHKDLKKIGSHRLSKIRRIQKYSLKWLQIKTNGIK